MVAYSPNLVLMKAVSERLRETTGLYFPESRLEELELKLRSPLLSLGLGSDSDHLQALLKLDWNDELVKQLTAALTISETYFFRNTGLWNFIETKLVPHHLQELQRCPTKTFRAWSSACCTGEEPYSLAIVLKKMVKATMAERMQILGTDINVNYLQQARGGIYSKWSLRGCSDTLIAQNFHVSAGSRYELAEEIRGLVEFDYFNLMMGGYPSADPSRKFDLIFCRNVLIYFREDDVAKILRRLLSWLTEDGYLVVSVHDMWNCKLEGARVDIFPDFVLISAKGGALPELTASANLPLSSTVFSVPKPVTKPVLPAQSPVADLHTAGSLSQIFVGGAATTAARVALDEATYEPQAQRVAEAFAAGRNDEELYLSEIFCFISCGNTDGALRCCEKALSFYPLNSTLYYIKASLLTEVQNYEAAVKALQQAVFVSNDYVIAYFALFSLNRRLGRADLAKVHLANTKRLLSAINKSDLLLDGDGLTAGQLEAIVKSIEGGLP